MRRLCAFPSASTDYDAEDLGSREKRKEIRGWSETSRRAKDCTDEDAMIWAEVIPYVSFQDIWHLEIATFWVYAVVRTCGK
jgi:hypothetical protein